MPTNRPFLSSFLSAFRAHSVITQQSQPKPTSLTTSSTTHTSTSTAQSASSPSNPRNITTTTKPGAGATTAALSTLHSPRTHHNTSALSPSPSPDTTSSNQTTTMQRRYIQERSRRGSDSSSEGFRDVLGAEKWYIGGRTAGGEERYFRLGTVRRRRSWGERSLDRLSL